MKHMAAAIAKNHFGELIDNAQRMPITIEKKGRPVVVVLSLQDYQHLKQAEDSLLVLEAKQAEAEGLLSPAKSKDFLDELKNAKD